MRLNRQLHLTLRAIGVSTVVVAGVVAAGLISAPSTNLWAMASDRSALFNFLTLVMGFAVFFGVLGGTLGAIVARRAMPDLEKRGALPRAVWGLKWGTVLGFLLPSTLLAVSWFSSPGVDSGSYPALLAFPMLGALAGALSGIIVSVCCLRPRHGRARTT
jgi:hypothetical protein